MKRVIVNADDFGRTPGINRGIIDSHRRGILTSTTVMVNFPDAAPGLEQAQHDAPQLGLGLHLTLTAGRPVSAPETVASLVDDDGVFYHITAWPQRRQQFEADHIQRELAAQVARFEALAGRRPDHLDAHHHAAYLHPVALEAMLEYARGLGIPLRAPGLAEPKIGPVLIRGLMPAAEDTFIDTIIAEAMPLVQAAPDDAWPARLELSFYDDGATLGNLLVILTTLDDNSLVEIMTHPGYVDEVLSGSSYAHQREDEVAYLTHAATRECVQSEGIQLITFAQI